MGRSISFSLVLLVASRLGGAGWVVPPPDIYYPGLLRDSVEKALSGPRVSVELGALQLPIPELQSGHPAMSSRAVVLDAPKRNSRIIFFTADAPATGAELWKSDGTAAGTALVKDIRPGLVGSNPEEITVAGRTLFFRANDGETGLELWKSDGSATGTALIKNIRPGALDFEVPESSVPSELIDVNGTLFFRADDGTHGAELWRSDGTTEGTVLVSDIAPGPTGSTPTGFADMNGTLFFRANDGKHGVELWRSDGTARGTVLVKDIAPGPESSTPMELTNVNGTLFFRAFELQSGSELWRSGGHNEDTVLVRDIRPGTHGQGIPQSSNPSGLTEADAKLFFRADDGDHGIELWRSDGTGLGTTLVADIHIGPEGSSPSEFISQGGLVFFQADDGDHGTEFWRSDGTAPSTKLVKDICPGPCDSFPNTAGFTDVKGSLFFRADDGSAGTELWKSDGTAAGTQIVRDIRSGLKSSGTPAGSDPAELTEVNGTLFFRAQDGSSGYEPWKSNGSRRGTSRIKDIRPGPDSSSPSGFTGHRTYLSGRACLNGDLRSAETNGADHGGTERRR